MLINIQNNTYIKQKYTTNMCKIYPFFTNN